MSIESIKEGHLAYKMKIAILDYGLSNLKSIENALNELRYEFSFVQSNENPTQFSNIILPGVGAFKDG